MGYLDNDGLAKLWAKMKAYVDSKIGSGGTQELLEDYMTPVLILSTSDLANGATTFECNWSEYQYLLIHFGNYSNVYETQLITRGYFRNTGSGARPIVLIPYNSTGAFWTNEVYKSDDTHVVVKTTATESNHIRCRIYGLAKQV